MRTDARREKEQERELGVAHLAGERRKTAAVTEELRRVFPAAWGRARLGFLRERERRGRDTYRAERRVDLGR